FESSRKAACVAATQLSEVEVTDQIRRQMAVESGSWKRTEEVHPQSAIVARDSSVKMRGMGTQSFALLLERATLARESATAAVNIPGEFRRRLLPVETIRGIDSAYAQRDKLTVSPRAWEPWAATEDSSRRLVYYATNRARSNVSREEGPSFSS